MYDYNNYGLTNSSSFESTINNFTGAVLALIILLVIIVLVLVVLVLVSNCKIFTKAGEKWWKGLIPLYNSWIETKITGLAWWWFPIFCGLTACTGFDSIQYVASMGLLLTSFNYNYNLAKKFGKSNGFAFLNTILPVIGLPILAFGSAKYNKDAVVDKNGIFSVAE